VKCKSLVDCLKNIRAGSPTAVGISSLPPSDPVFPLWCQMYPWYYKSTVHDASEETKAPTVNIELSDVPVIVKMSTNSAGVVIIAFAQFLVMIKLRLAVAMFPPENYPFCLMTKVLGVVASVLSWLSLLPAVRARVDASIVINPEGIQLSEQELKVPSSQFSHS